MKNSPVSSRSIHTLYFLLMISLCNIIMFTILINQICSKSFLKPMALVYVIELTNASKICYTFGPLARPTYLSTNPAFLTYDFPGASGLAS